MKKIAITLFVLLYLNMSFTKLYVIEQALFKHQISINTNYLEYNMSQTKAGNSILKLKLSLVLS